MHEAESNKTISSIILGYTGGNSVFFFEVLKSEIWASFSLFFRNVLKHSEERVFYWYVWENNEGSTEEWIHAWHNKLQNFESVLLLYTTKTFSPKSTRKQYCVFVCVSVCVFLCWCHFFFNFFICFTAKTKNIMIWRKLRNYTEVTEFILLGLTSDP